MASITSQHVAAGAGGLIGGSGIAHDLAGVLIGHGVDPTLAYNEAGLAITVVGTLGALFWAWLRRKDPELASHVGELASFEPDYEHEAAMMEDAVHQILVARGVIPATVPSPEPVKPAGEPVPAAPANPTS